MNPSQKHQRPTGQPVYAEVLSQKIEMGQYDETTALKIIRTICYDTPGALLGMKPADRLAR